MVEVIDDPACILTDELRVIPKGCDPAGFMINRYYEDGKVPAFALGEYISRALSIEVRATIIPTIVTTKVETHPVQKLYPDGRARTLPDEVIAHRVKWNKNEDKLATEMKKGYDFDLLDGNYLFRGLSLHALEESAKFMLPIIGRKGEAEFGPGIYTTPNIETAIKYAGPAGAVLVFKIPSFRRLHVWEPEGEEWQQLVNRSSRLGLAGVMPEAYQIADVIIGPISGPPPKAVGKKKSLPVPDADQMQTVFVSCPACARLGQALKAIIYLGDGK